MKRRSGFLKQVFGTQNDVFMIPGAGSASLEAAVGSMVASGEKALVLVHGFFSQRLGKIAQACGIETVNVESQWGKPILPEQLQKALEADGNDQGGGHGASRDLHRRAQSAERAGGGRPSLWSAGHCGRRLFRWRRACAGGRVGRSSVASPWPTSVWKRLAGLGIVSVSPRAWEVIASKSDRARGWYLNLNVWREYSLDWDWHPYPTTLPTNNIVALHKSLQGHPGREGLETRYARYRAAAHAGARWP